MYKVKETFEYLVNDPNNFCSVHDALEMDTSMPCPCWDGSKVPVNEKGEEESIPWGNSKVGVFWDSWDGLLNVTQTGMNSSGEPFAFSMDNDRNDQQKLINTLAKAQVEGWKVKIKYHQVWGCKNVFKNRGESDYFVDDVIILDKNFSKIGDIVKGTNKTAPHDTLYVKIVK